MNAKGGSNIIDLLLFFACCACIGAALGLTQVRSAAPIPQLRIRPSEVALGEVDQRGEIPFEFHIDNVGRRRAFITEVVRPCSCTTLDLPIGTSLGPSTTLGVRGAIDTTSRRGTFHSGITLTYQIEGAPARHSLAIPIRAFVKPSITVSHDVLRIHEGWSNLRLGPGTATSFRILGVEASDPYIHWECVDSQLGAECTSFQLRVRLDRSKTPFTTATRSDTGHWLQFTTSVATEPNFRVPVVFETPDEES
jgi:hypothetical protein